MVERARVTNPTVIDHVTCLGCGCACDDIGVVVRDGRIVDTRNTCQLGLSWFGDGQVTTACRAGDRDVALREAIRLAATSLHEAQRPLVYLTTALSCESQRAAVAVADVAGARLDSITSATVAEFVLAGQERGWASATFGEVRNRADVVVFWGVDIEGRYPRFPSRYAPGPVGTHVPHGRASRTVIAVDVGDARATADADEHVAVAPADELATLTAIESLVRSPAAASPHSEPTGASWVTAREILPRLLAARYLAIVYDAEPDDRASRTPARFHALASLAQSLNQRTRCAGIALRAGGNRPGADSVLVAQTGYPFAVDFARGHPRYDPHSASALALLRRADADVVLIVGDPSLVPRDIAQALADVRCVLIGPGASGSPLGASRVVIDTGIDGVHVGGTALRADDVPVPLRRSGPGPPSAAAVVTAVATAVLQLQRGA
jgi:formylmethanofuran dehydrogenase subunit B